MLAGILRFGQDTQQGDTDAESQGRVKTIAVQTMLAAAMGLIVLFGVVNIGQSGPTCYLPPYLMKLADQYRQHGFSIQFGGDNQSAALAHATKKQLKCFVELVEQ